MLMGLVVSDDGGRFQIDGALSREEAADLARHLTGGG
jgi:preprotein translocase subunit SecD